MGSGIQLSAMLLLQELKDLQNDPPTQCSAGTYPQFCYVYCDSGSFRCAGSLAKRSSRAVHVLFCWLRPVLAHAGPVSQDDLFHWQATIMGCASASLHVFVPAVQLLICTQLLQKACIRSVACDHLVLLANVVSACPWAQQAGFIILTVLQAW